MLCLLYYTFWGERNIIHRVRNVVLCVIVCPNTTEQDAAPIAMHNWTWCKMFKEDYLCSAKESGRLPLSEEMVERVRERIVQSPRRASPETKIPQMSVWRVSRKLLRMTSFKLQIVQTLKSHDKHKIKFRVSMQDKWNCSWNPLTFEFLI